MVWRNILYSITSGGVFRAHPSRTQSSMMEQLAKTVKSLKPMAVFTENFFFEISILQLSIDYPRQLRLEFSNHYAIKQLSLKQKGFIMLENSRVALVITPSVLIYSVLLITAFVVFIFYFVFLFFLPLKYSGYILLI